MNKVIIITRSNEYDEQDRAAFGAYVKKELEGDTFFSDGKCAVEKMLAAISKVSSMGGNYYLPAKDAGINIEDDKIDVKKQLIIKYASDTEIDKSKKCYVQIKHPPYEVILLLWDALDQDPGRKIEHFDLFVDALCKDCNVTDANNYLYIHDKQLFGTEHEDEEILFDGKCKEGYEYFKKHFKYVAVFQHATGGMFINRILQFRFGERIKTARISELELTATSFSELRQQADSILENDSSK